MSTTETDRPVTPSQDDCPTEIIPAPIPAPVPTRRSILRTAPIGQPAAQPERPASPFADWRGQAPTEEMPAVSSQTGPARHRERQTLGTGRAARGAGIRRHLRAALAALSLAAAILVPMQLFAAQGISSARQAALQSARGGAPARTYSTPSQTEGGGQPAMSGQTAPMSDRTSSTSPDDRSDIQAEWVTEDAGAPYDRTNPTASPLDLPRCTTSPDTPLPCLATISPSQTRAVVLEEDASLTALVRH